MRAKRPIYSNTYDKRRKWWLALIIAVLVLAAIAGSWWWLHRNPRPSAKRYPDLGVRVDQTFGTIDAAELKDHGVSFVYLKATQGASFVDDAFATNYSRAAELQVGVYHYYSFDSSPQAQAQNFLAHVGSSTGTLPIGIYVTYYGDYAQDPPQPAKLAANLKQLIAALNDEYSNGVMLMGTPSVLAKLTPYLAGVKTYAITTKKPKGATYWEYANAKLPGGDTAYHDAVKMTDK